MRNSYAIHRLKMIQTVRFLTKKRYRLCEKRYRLCDFAFFTPTLIARAEFLGFFEKKYDDIKQSKKSTQKKCLGHKGKNIKRLSEKSGKRKKERERKRGVG